MHCVKKLSAAIRIDELERFPMPAEAIALPMLRERILPFWKVMDLVIAQASRIRR